MALTITLNGQAQEFRTLEPNTSLDALVQALDLKADRIAVELNGTIAPRAGWAATPVSSGDKLEIVHFVGGGACSAADVHPRA